MSTLHPQSLLPAALLLALTTPPARAQVPDNHLVVSTANYPPVAVGTPGIYFVDTRPPHTITPVTGLPAALAGVAPSNGTNCVVRDPRTERLLCGNSVLNGGPLTAYLLTLNGAAVTAWDSVPLGTVPAFDMGLNAAAFLPDGDILLAVGRIVSGSTANQPLLRWTPPNPTTGPNGVLVPVPLQTPYTTPGNLCNAVTATPDGQTAIGAFKTNALFGASMLFDVAAVPLIGGPPAVLTSLAQGEFVTAFSWACSGELLAVTAQFPLGVGGRVITWAGSGASWVQTGSTSYTGAGLFDFNAVCVDPASCMTYVNANGQEIHAIPSGGSPMLLTPGPASQWGLVTGLDINPCPEVTEAPTPSPMGLTPNWAYRPFPSAPPILGSTFTMQLHTGPNAALTAGFLSFLRQTSNPLGLHAYLDLATSSTIGTIAGPDPVFALAIPNVAALVGIGLFGQAASIDTNLDLAASDLIHFRLH